MRLGGDGLASLPYHKSLPYQSYYSFGWHRCHALDRKRARQKRRGAPEDCRCDGDAAHPAVERSIGVFPSNQRANGFGHADHSTRQRAFLSAMLSLQARAVQEGGNAVIKITSYYKRNVFSSTSEFECGAGALMVGVALRGEVVKLKN